MKNKYEEGKGPLICDNKCFPEILLHQDNPLLRMPES